MKYNYEIRLKAVKLVLEGGLSVREAGCHLGCGRSQVHLWVSCATVATVQNLSCQF